MWEKKTDWNAKQAFQLTLNLEPLLMIETLKKKGITNETMSENKDVYFHQVNKSNLDSNTVLTAQTSMVNNP